MDLLADRRVRLEHLPHLRLEAVLGRDHLVFRVLRVVGLDERVHQIATRAHFPLLRERDLQRLPQGLRGGLLVVDEDLHGCGAAVRMKRLE